LKGLSVLDLYILAVFTERTHKQNCNVLGGERKFVYSAFISNLETLHEHFMLPLAVFGLHLEWWIVGVAVRSLVISANIYTSVTVSVNSLQ
jgi:hypothetical protein